MAIEHADFEGIERLALVLGGEIVSTFGCPEKVKLGSCKLIEEVMIGEDKVRRRRSRGWCEREREGGGVEEERVGERQRGGGGVRQEREREREGEG